MKDKQPTIFVVDDDAAVRDSLAVLGAAMGWKVAGYTHAEEFLSAVDDTQAGCLIADVRMPGMSGLELQDRLAELDVRLPIIIITGHGDVPMSVRAMKRGAVDFLEKPFEPEELARCIEEALRIDAERREQLEPQKQAEAQLSLLTPEERTVLHGIADGKTNADIAKEMDISLRTVQFRRASVIKKVGVQSKKELVQLARLAGDALRGGGIGTTE